MLRSLFPLLLMLLMSAAPSAAQLRLPIAVETRGGYAIPRGEFGRGEEGPRPQAGPRFAVGGGLVLTRLLAVYGSYSHSRFGCANCSGFELGNDMVGRAGEAGIEIRLLRAGPFGARPWLRGGVVYQTLGFSAAAAGERMTSRGDVGYAFGAGLAVPVSGALELRPGVGYTSVQADFEFTSGLTRSLNVHTLLFEFGAAVRLGGLE